MLVSAEPVEHMGRRAYAHFQSPSHFMELLTLSAIDWQDLPRIPEQPPPF